MFARLLFIGLALIVGASIARGQGKAKVARQTAEYVMRKFGKEAAEVGVETLTRRIEVLIAKHGDEALVAVKKIGPRALTLADEAGVHGAESLSIKLMAKQGGDAVWVVAKPNRLAIFVKYGDDAAEAMIKHGEIADPLLQSLGKPAAGALKAVSPQAGRRLAILAEGGELAQMGRTPELLDVVGKYGDRAMDFVWRNKGSLTVTAALAAFLADPQPFIDGTVDITRIAADSTVKPLAAEAAKRINWTVVGLAALGAVVVLVAARAWLSGRTGKVAPPAAGDHGDKPRG